MSTSSTGPTTPVYFSGVSSYASDFQSIISRQQKIANIPITRLQNKQADDTSRIQLLGNLRSDVAALGSSIAALGALGASQGLTANSSDSSVTVTNSGSTKPGTYTITSIKSLASPASVSSTSGYTDPTTAPVVTPDAENKYVAQLVVGSTSYNLTLATNNLQGLQDAINASGAPVSASIVNTGNGATPNYLMLTADSGGATPIQVNDPNAGGGPVSLLNNNDATTATTYADTTNAQFSASDSLQLVVGTDTYAVSLAGNNNLNGALAALNGIAGNPVTASIVTAADGNSALKVTANPGQLGSVALNVQGSTTNLLINDAHQGSSAAFSLQGVDGVITRDSNSISDVISGVSFVLNRKNDNPVTLSVAADRTQLTNALSTLVTNYNKVVDDENAQRGPAAGPLSGDMAVQAVQTDLRQLMTYQAPGANTMSLAALGVRFADNTGKLSFDPTQIDGFTDSQLSSAFAYLGTSTTGFGTLASQFSELTNPISGLIKTETDGLNQEYQDLSSQANALNLRVTSMVKALTDQLAKADAALAQLQSQQQVLTSSIQSVDLALYGQNFGNSMTK